jgi:hypothetical protein
MTQTLYPKPGKITLFHMVLSTKLCMRVKEFPYTSLRFPPLIPE